MKIIALFTLLVILSQFTFSQDFKITKINGLEVADGELLIKFKKPQGKLKASQITLARETVIEKHSVNKIKSFRTGAEHWKVPEGKTEEIINELKNNEFVEYVEPNYIRRATVTPNDTQYNQQWGLHNTGQTGGLADADIDAPEAWGITTGDSNITVGIIDSGIDYNHEDLVDNIWINSGEIPNNGVDDDNNGYIDDYYGWDFVNNDNEPLDDLGHGTHVAGIVGAKGNNNIGVTGVVWDCKLIALKFLDNSGSGPVSDAVKAVEYATSMGIKIINASYGSYGYSQTEFDAISAAHNAGILFIAAAGNESNNNDILPHYPSDYNIPNIISVASTDKNDDKSGFSNFGINNVELGAPGSAIYSTLPNNTYGFKSGTSMAAPYVSGAAVAAWSVFNNFTVTEIKSQLLNSVDVVSSLSGNTVSSGRLNLFKAVSQNVTLPISPSLNNIVFGAGIINQNNGEIYLVLSNSINQDIVIDSIRAPNGFQIKKSNGTYSNLINSFTLNASGKDSIAVVFAPSTAEKYQASLNIYLTDQNSQKKSISPLLKGQGFASGTIINAGPVSGTWTQALSPYIVNGDISVDSNRSLRIEPGVNVLFANYYKIVVSYNSTLIAHGSETDSIYFQAADTTIGWAGLDINYRENEVDSIVYCVFENGKAQKVRDESMPPNFLGGAISITDGSPFISNCTFRNNSALAGLGGAICVFGNSFPALTHLKFDNNTASYGGAIAIMGVEFETKACLLNNILFVNNKANYGGALYNQQSNLILNNLTFFNNNAHMGGGAINLWVDSSVELKNSILVGNTSPDGDDILFGSYLTPSTLNIDYCNVDTTNSNWYSHPSNYSDLDAFEWGNGNISVDPLFVNVNNNDLSLSSNSPCIDAGDPNDDVGEEPFPNGYRINMGYNGGTRFATETTQPGLAIIPNPLDFGTLNVNENKLLPLLVKNGSPVTINISEISLSGTSKFTISPDHNTSRNLSSGDIDSIMIDFSSNINLDSLYQSFITIKTIETSDLTIPVNASILIGTPIISDVVSGIWTKEESPYNIYNNISVENNKSLIIEPGVTVRFMGKYYFKIGESCKLLAQGTQISPIIFTAIDTTFGWYGIDIINSGNDDLLEYCNISRGNADGTYPQNYGGALYIKNSDPIIRHSVLENNRGNFGAGLYLDISNAYFYDVIIRNNTSLDNGTICVNNSTMAIFENCSINANFCSGYGGGFGIWLNSFVSIKNSTISNNIGSSSGGGICVHSSSVDLINVTMVNNLTTWRGNEIILIDDAHLNLINSIIYNDVGIESIADIFLDSYSNPTENTLSISYSNIDTLKNNWVSYQTPKNATITWGSGNNTLDPQFTDVDNSIFTLKSTSPYINVGTPDTTGLNLPQSDLAGNLRIWDDRIDLGAYEFGSSKEFNRALNKGWNWFSVYLENIDMSVSTIMSSLNPQAGDYIKDRKGAGNSSTYYNGAGFTGWFPALEIDPKETYKMKLGNPGDLTYTGSLVDENDREIAVNPGWSWIGYPFSFEMSVSEYLASLDQAENDYIKDQVNSATYYDSYGWFGELERMEPGNGYALKVTNAGTINTSDPENFKPSTIKAKEDIIFEISKFKVNTSDFEYSGSATIEVYINGLNSGTESNILYAFNQDDVCVGMINGKLYPMNNKFLYNLMMFSNIEEGDEIHFKFFESEKDTWYSFEESMSFVNDMIVAKAFQPFELKKAFATDQNEFEISVDVYPNPFSESIFYTFTLNEEKQLRILIINASGASIELLKDQKFTRGKHSFEWNNSNLSEGIYYLRFESDGFEKTVSVIKTN